jgi:hypothetical protein
MNPYRTPGINPSISVITPAPTQKHFDDCICSDCHLGRIRAHIEAKARFELRAMVCFVAGWGTILAGWLISAAIQSMIPAAVAFVLVFLVVAIGAKR